MYVQKPKVNIILGPIIGKVTENTARVLIEIDYEGHVACVLTSSASKECCIARPNKGFPTVFPFQNLIPGLLYRVSLVEVGQKQNMMTPYAPPEFVCIWESELHFQSAFRTLTNNPYNRGTLKFGIVSCNDITIAQARGDKDLWWDLAQKTSNQELDYIFHIGDQCYMDMTNGKSEAAPYQMIKQILDGTPREKWESYRWTLLEILRKHQRETWSHKPTAFALANVPNLTILDDHEIRDDWGWRPEDWDPSTMKCDYFYGQLARQVYYEYQRQLREDIDWNNFANMKQEYHDHILNGIGVVFLEYRGSRSWFREEKVVETQLGVRQTEWLQSLFNQGGKFDREQVDSVIFISPLPPVYLAGTLTMAAALVVDDAQEHWTFRNAKQLAGVLNMLRGYKQRKNGRDVTILGGDVHVGVDTDIYYNGELMFKQLTTSAINNVLTKKHEYFVVKTSLAMSDKLNDNYTFKHMNLVKKNNYGQITLVSNKVVQFGHVTNKLIGKEEKVSRKQKLKEMGENCKVS